MKKGLLAGYIVFFVGLNIGLVGLFGWIKARAAVEEMTREEVVQYEKKLSMEHSKSIFLPSDKKDIANETVVPHFRAGEEAAKLIIPKLKQKYSIYWGTKEDALKQGIGMYVSKWTVVPGQKGHTVLSGHRDTVFSRLDELKTGDFLWVEFNGAEYLYEIKKIWITDAADKTVIVKKGEQILTLTTCYPFNYFGNAPKRYIIQSERRVFMDEEM